MRRDRKTRFSPVIMARHRIALLVCWVLAAVAEPFTLVSAMASSTLEVEARDALPGFRRTDLPRYLALHMARAGLSEWRFEPTTGREVAADRVEWSFKLNPYAGGEVRSFGHRVTQDWGFGVHRPITIEARLYLNGEYQTLVEQQALVQGGPDDLDLATAVASATRNLLGPSGAYRAIDTGLGRANHAR